MANISLKVELPAHSHSFQVHVPESASIGNIKSEISKSCPGGPKVEGQRLIYAGRLLRDDEQVQDIWPSPQHSRTLHLAVHPSAWTTGPPKKRPAPLESVPALTPTVIAHPPFPSTSYHTPIYPQYSHRQPYILAIHEWALAVLSANSQAEVPLFHLNDTDAHKQAAQLELQYRGWAWPEVFDKPIPPFTPGLKYERVMKDGQSFLSLSNPNAVPSALQTHVLNILGYTYTLLSSLPPPPTVWSQYLPTPTPTILYPPAPVHPNVPLPNVAQPQAEREVLFEIAINFRQFPVRALLTPLFMLAMRATLIMYFFSPDQTPFFGAIMGLWILYEAWSAIRAAVAATQDPAEHRGDENGQVQGDINGGAGVAGPNGQEGQDAARPSDPRRQQMNAILNAVANINIREENEMLEASGDLPPPTFVHGVKTFASLMIVTLIPALWDRRRAELMRREGALRTEMDVITAARAPLSFSGSAAQARNAPTEGEGENEASAQEQEESRRARDLKWAVIQKHARRPDWVREYVERAGKMEYYDD
ncbi:hypothetical protein BDM02DRAFT_3091734 [Thelephora ganbajun]|uniref:Uncharacterized protein n=1 Tax=Thelephora ganbajun TaxID=370292 RepID=A0ACB6ZNP9_THEGA|nr:hypothetical protein BDM02DRAFT_3091734 [Thelephora ganbajun]